MHRCQAPLYPLEWLVTSELVPYPKALEEMETRVRQLLAGEAGEWVWCLEHPPLYTAGTSAKARDLLSNDFPVFQSGRGGQMTYHGPGQRVVYLMLDLRHRVQDLRLYVSTLEQWISTVLKRFDVEATPRAGRIGLWVETPQGEEKIAAIGIRVKKWMTLHGIALNVHPDLDPFKGIIPCGLKDFGVTSLQKLGKNVSMREVDQALQEAFLEFF